MQKKHKIIIFTGKGIAAPYILQDSKKALEKMGCEVREFPVTQPARDVRPVLESFRPDFALSLDHSGIDEEIFEKEKIYCLSWFVDNPLYFISEENRSPYNIFFVTDRSYLPVLKNFGFENVFYLPLGTNPARMSFRKASDFPEPDVSFVGSLGRRYTEWQEERNGALLPPMKDVMELLIQKKIREPRLTFAELFDHFDSRLEKKFFSALTMPLRGSVELRIDMEVSSWFREKYLLALEGMRVSVFGDDSWQRILPGSFYFGGPIDYDTGTPVLYRKSKVNLNVTRAQIQTGINQRILDISAAGAVFLTDFREATQDFFDFDIRSLQFRDENELKENARRLVSDAPLRLLFARELFKCVCRSHTYDNRMAEMLRIAEEIRA